MSHIVLILVTPSPPTIESENSQRRVITWMQTKHIRYKEVDAVDEKAVREELTGISGIKGNYPQIFITDQADETTYIGDYEAIESLLELDDVDEEVLKANPDLKTFSQVFADCKE
mmetsp:Transcript_18256/g.35867  ORF Transcript_18256/g.35867 Transcript_18256/m.35867 type:complete len:115 (+) Transcript_18256:82-426(+)|eukprot:CAMPEP_0171503656 /NCGR_PEP_ID=MMETSP0958-20121227/11036_1 /TAXON_ID=87120 /ORGANISM="Aurantiochytrium limacinum, Strain ATCCMYA-1381" /LENGTH=114 /DNA_ID=CAMNT_0012039209 /DNA_START=16 /DNA_END=360 /DNA_ORIENTATION=+